VKARAPGGPRERGVSTRLRRVGGGGPRQFRPGGKSSLKDRKPPERLEFGHSNGRLPANRRQPLELNRDSPIPPPPLRVLRAFVAGLSAADRCSPISLPAVCESLTLLADPSPSFFASFVSLW